jgi:hypothetical protein
MTDIEWEQEGSMTRSTAAGEALVMRGNLRQLVGNFLEMNADQQRGVAIRVAGPDWTREYIDEEIRELAARPEFTGAYGRYDSESDADAPDERDEADPLVVEEGISGSGRA